MDSSENRDIVHDFLDAGSRGDLDRGLELLAEDVRWTNIGSTRYSGTFVGRDALMTELLGPVFGQLEDGISSTIENTIAEGEFVVVQSRGSARTVHHQPYNNTYCHVFRISDGRIIEVTEYFDTELAAKVLEP